MNIDVHGHVVVKEIQRSATHRESWRPEVTRQANGWQMLRGDGYVNGPIPAEIVEWPGIIERLDATGVDLMAVSPAPFLFFYNLEPQVGLTACRIQNDAIAAAVAAHPSRLAGLGVVPLQDAALAVQELERIVRDLGMPGVEIGCSIAGAYPGEARFRPFWHAAQELGAFVLVHPEVPYGADALKDYYLINLLGNPADTTRSAADVVFGGVLEDCPGLRICFVHGGGAVPYIRGRLEHGYHVRPEPKARVQRPPSAYLKQLYFDTITHWGPALEFLVRTVGPEHVLLGSDYPFDMGPADPVGFVRQQAGIDATAKQMILGGNAASLLKLG